MDPASTEAAFSVSAHNRRRRWPGHVYLEHHQHDAHLYADRAAGLWRRVYDRSVDNRRSLPATGQPARALPSSFTVVPLPAVVSTIILNGSEAVNPETELRMRFSAPVSETSVLNNIQITPLVTKHQRGQLYLFRLLRKHQPEHDQHRGTDPAELQHAPDGQLVQGAKHHLYGHHRRRRDRPVRQHDGRTTPSELYHRRLPPAGAARPRSLHPLQRLYDHRGGRQVSQHRRVDAELFRLPLADLYLLGGENQWQVWDKYQIPNREQNLIWSKSVPADGPRNVINLMGFKLVDADGNPLPPGVYMLEVRDPLDMAQGDNQAQPAVQKAVIVLSNNNITIKRGSQGDSLAWVTDMPDGLPVGDAPIVFTKSSGELAQDTTDADGMATAALGLTQPNSTRPSLPPAASRAIPTSPSSPATGTRASNPGSFNLRRAVLPPAVINLYTERPIYRPGQTVYWKGIIRLLQDDMWSVPAAGESFKIRINDALAMCCSNATTRSTSSARSTASLRWRPTHPPAGTASTPSTSKATRR